MSSTAPRTGDGIMEADRKRRRENEVCASVVTQGIEMIPPSITQDDDKYKKWKELLKKLKELLPGIPNEITLAQIFTKLPWSTICTLSSVSPAFQQAIQAGLVYDTRVRTRSADTFVLINASDKDGTECDEDEAESDENGTESDEDGTESDEDGTATDEDGTETDEDGTETDEDGTETDEDDPSSDDDDSSSDDDFEIATDDDESETDDEDTHATRFGLYSLRDKTIYPLPPITEVERGIPYGSQCIALDGKLYVLGGVKEIKDETCQLGSKEVHVLDLGGQRQWKQCASMHEARLSFGCGVKDGQIYVFGGTSLRSPLGGSEVYNPRIDAWSAIRPMGCLWSHNEVATAGENLFVHNGFSHRDGSSDYVESNALKAYHPGTDTWRTVSNDFGHELQVEFVALGKFHSLSMSKIYVYDIERDQWMERHTCLFPAYPERYVWPISVVTTDKELLAIVEASWGARSRTSLLQSRGFGGVDKEIRWEELPFSLTTSGSPTMCILKL